MSYEITGKICQIGDTVQVNDKFKKREFVLHTQEEVNGNIYDSYVKMQLVQGKCDLIDNYKLGDRVKVNFNIKGNKWERDGNVNYITNLDAWRLESAAAQTSNTEFKAPEKDKLPF